MDNIINALWLLFFKWGNPSLFFVYFRPFKQSLQFLQQINVKNAHPVSGAVIWAHNLLIISLLPWPLDQGYRPALWLLFATQGAALLANF